MGMEEDYTLSRGKAYKWMGGMNVAKGKRKDAWERW